jgi:hypothetical protein
MRSLMFILLGYASLGGAAYATNVDDCLGFTFSSDNIEDTARCSPITTLVPTHHYFYLANPTVTTLGGFEFSWFADPPFSTQPLVLGAEVLGLADYTDDYSNYIIRFDTPVPTSEITVLVDLSMMYLTSPLMEAFYVGPSEPAAIPGTPAIIDGSQPDVVVPTFFPDGTYTEPNGFAVLGGIEICPAAEPTSWSTIKALYRR